MARLLPILTLIFLMFIGVGDALSAPRLLVFAPSSMAESIQKIAARYDAINGSVTKISVAGTAQLARQLEAGAPADLFISADTIWMDWLSARNLIRPDTIKAIAANKLVLAVRNETENWIDVEAALTSSRFAMADPNSVPAGRYAKQALISKSWWDSAKRFATYGENVRVALRRLTLGEVSSAIVYQSDLHIEPRARAAFLFSETDHAPIIYSAALSKNARSSSDAFLSFLNSQKARNIFLQAGFLPAPKP